MESGLNHKDTKARRPEGFFMTSLFFPAVHLWSFGHKKCAKTLFGSGVSFVAMAATGAAPPQCSLPSVSSGHFSVIGFVIALRVAEFFRSLARMWTLSGYGLR